MEPRFLIGTKPAWPCFPDIGQLSTINVAVDHTVGDPDFERKNQVTMVQKPLNMRFACRRQSNHVDPNILNIYQQAIVGLSRGSLKTNLTGCWTGRISKYCGNSRGELFECSCEILNGIKYPQLRHQYENKVIDAVLNIIYSDPLLRSLNIAIFASGGLFGEFVLMVRLIDRLKNIGFNGTIELFLIDQQYRDNINKAYDFDPSTCSNGFPWVNFLGGRQDLAQFLQEISLCLPSTIQVNGAVFGEADDYINRALKDSRFRHDLLIGADIEDTQAIVSKLKLQAQRNNVPGIVLIKQNNQPKICEIKSSSGQFFCSAI